MKISCFFLFLNIVLFANAQKKTYDYINQYRDIAVLEMEKYGIPASITLAQGILESGNGESRLAVMANNHFGIKCHSDWKGEVIYEDDDEKNECFRKYTKVEESYRDHSLFLFNRKRYSFLFKYRLTNYKKWAKGLKKAGYATNPDYHRLLINLIEKYDLSKLDIDNDLNSILYFSYSYGAPYLIGFGAYYFKNSYLFFSEINSSFIFSSFSVGYNYEFFHGIYSGVNLGFVYYLSDIIFDYSYTSVPFISIEKLFDLRKKRKQPVLIKVGTQFPFDTVDITKEGLDLIPYFRINYFIN